MTAEHVVGEVAKAARDAAAAKLLELGADTLADVLDTFEATVRGFWRPVIKVHADRLVFQDKRTPED